MQPESRFRMRVKKDLDALTKAGAPLWCVKIQQVALRGVPDFLVCAGGLFLALELKKDAREKPTALQEWTLRNIGAARGICMVSHPERWIDDLAKIKSLLP